MHSQIYIVIYSVVGKKRLHDFNGNHNFMSKNFLKHAYIVNDSNIKQTFAISDQKEWWIRLFSFSPNSMPMCTICTGWRLQILLCINLECTYAPGKHQALQLLVREERQRRLIHGRGLGGIKSFLRGAEMLADGGSNASDSPRAYGAPIKSNINDTLVPIRLRKRKAEAHGTSRESTSPL